MANHEDAGKEARIRVEDMLCAIPGLAAEATKSFSTVSSSENVLVMATQRYAVYMDIRYM